jgi:hypothetical protein
MTAFTVTILCHSDGLSDLGCAGQLLKIMQLIHNTGIMTTLLLALPCVLKYTLASVHLCSSDNCGDLTSSLHYGYSTQNAIKKSEYMYILSYSVAQ